MNNNIQSMWNSIPSHEIITKTAKRLEANGIHATIAISLEDAKQQALSRIPEMSEVMTMTSATSDTLGLTKTLNETGKYRSVRNTLASMSRDTDNVDMQKLGAAPEYAIGSVHAVTENGELIIASNTGSQLPAYAYGSGTVVFIVGAQKIVSNLEQAMKRIYDYVLPLESERARKAYGVEGSFVSKLLIIKKEVKMHRIQVILVPEIVGY